MSTFQWVPEPGAIVGATLTDRRFSQIKWWRVEECCDGRVTIRRDDLGCRISVDRATLHTLTIVAHTDADTANAKTIMDCDLPLAPRSAPDTYQQWFDETFSPDNFETIMNQWKELPGVPGNRIRIIKMQPQTLAVCPITTPEQLSLAECTGREPLLYPSLALRGLTLEFHSTLFCETIVLEGADGLGWCPAGHVWVICLACGKFHFPAHGPNSHRQSSRHLKKMSWCRDCGLGGSMGYYAQSTVTNGRPRFL